MGESKGITLLILKFWARFWLTPLTVALPPAKEHRFHYTKRVGGGGVGPSFGLTKYGDEKIPHTCMYKFLCCNKINITFTINIPVPSNTVQLFVLQLHDQLDKERTMEGQTFR